MPFMIVVTSLDNVSAATVSLRVQIGQRVQADDTIHQ